MGRKRSELRQHRRFEVHDIEGSFQFRLDVVVLNLSVAGMAVETTQVLQIGRRYTFTVSHDEATLTLTGTVMWCGLRGTRKAEDEEVVPLYHAGIRFDDVLTPVSESLRQMIEESAIVGVAPRIFGRFRLGPDTSVTVQSGVDLEVRKLSMSGVEVESDHCPEVGAELPLEVALANGLLSCTGKVKKVEPVDRRRQSGRHRIVLGLSHLSDEARATLDGFIAFLVNAENGNE